MKRLTGILSANRLLLLLLFFWVALNVCQAIFTELTDLEAYGWVLSQEFEWGYYGTSPLFVWLIGLSTTFFGNGELAVRLFPILLQPIYIYLFWLALRPVRATKKLAALYFFICFALPLFQYYGYVSSVSAPLLFGVGLFLYAYRKFLRQGQESFLWAIVMGVSWGVILYSEYFGLVVVGLILLSNRKLLTNYLTYVAAAVAAVLFLPHIYWLIETNWVSFGLVSMGKTSGFFGYLLSVLLLFNPLLVPFFFLLLVKKSRAAVRDEERLFSSAMRFVSWGLLVFCLLISSSFGVKAQWLLPLSFPIIYFLIRGAQTRPVLYRWLGKIGFFMILLFLGMRVFLILYEGKIGGVYRYSNQHCTALHSDLGGRPFIADGDFAMASKMRYYGGNESFAQSSIFGNISHYDMRQNYANLLFGSDVAIELSKTIRKQMNPQQLEADYQKVKFSDEWIYYDTINNFKPTSRVRIATKLPLSVMSGRGLTLSIVIENPYSYSFDFVGVDYYSVVMQLKDERGVSFEIPIEVRSKVLPGMGRVREGVVARIPLNVPTNDYQASFSLFRYPFGGVYNSPKVTLRVVKP